MHTLSSPAAYKSLQRQKEIGIRKVLGASVSGVVGMLSKEFLSLVCLALAMAIPLAWCGADKWLQGFAYRVDITPGIFAATSLTVTLITFLAISYQSIKAALVNPAHSLRSE